MVDDSYQRLNTPGSDLDVDLIRRKGNVNALGLRGPLSSALMKQ